MGKGSAGGGGSGAGAQDVFPCSLSPLFSLSLSVTDSRVAPAGAVGAAARAVWGGGPGKSLTRIRPHSSLLNTRHPPVYSRLITLGGSSFSRYMHTGYADGPYHAHSIPSRESSYARCPHMLMAGGGGHRAGGGVHGGPYLEEDLLGDPADWYVCVWACVCVRARAGRGGSCVCDCRLASRGWWCPWGPLLGGGFARRPGRLARCV